MNHSLILLGSLCPLGRRGLESIEGERTMEGLKGGTGGKGIARGIGVVEIGEVEIGEDSFGGKLSCKRIEERGLVAQTGIKEAMCSKDTIRKGSIGDEKDVTRGEERIDIEEKESDIEIMFDLGEGDGEIEIITESTKMGEERAVETGNGEEVKEKVAGRTGEECGRVTMGSLAWPWLSSGMLKASSPLAFDFKLLFLFLVFRGSLLIERLILRRSDRCYCQRA